MIAFNHPQLSSKINNSNNRSNRNSNWHSNKSSNTSMLLSSKRSSNKRIALTSTPLIAEQIWGVDVRLLSFFLFSFSEGKTGSKRITHVPLLFTYIKNKGEGIMYYKTMIKNLIFYGKGVFSITMLDDKNERQSLKRFIYRNPEMFKEIKGTNGDIKLLRVTSIGKKYFLDGKLVKSDSIKSENFFTLLDAGLVNAYMIEQNKFFKYSLRPHEPIAAIDHQISLISSRWGSPPIQQLEKSQQILCLKDSVKYLDGLPNEIISKVYIPKAFAFIRSKD